VTDAKCHQYHMTAKKVSVEKKKKDLHNIMADDYMAMIAIPNCHTRAGYKRNNHIN
jgi:hypothetical protein